MNIDCTDCSRQKDSFHFSHFLLIVSSFSYSVAFSMSSSSLPVCEVSWSSILFSIFMILHILNVAHNYSGCQAEEFAKCPVYSKIRGNIIAILTENLGISSWTKIARPERSREHRTSSFWKIRTLQLQPFLCSTGWVPAAFFFGSLKERKFECAHIWQQTQLNFEHELFWTLLLVNLKNVPSRVRTVKCATLLYLFIYLYVCLLVLRSFFPPVFFVFCSFIFKLFPLFWFVC